MDIWRMAGDDTDGQSGAAGAVMASFIGIAARIGCTLVPRDLPASIDVAACRPIFGPVVSPGGAPVNPEMPPMEGSFWRPDARVNGPIIVWQETDEARTRAAMLLAGADEVIGPWMDGDEALARLLRLVRRPKGSGQRIVLGDLAIDLVDHSARRADRPLDLLAREYELLLHLARHCGRVQSRETLLRSIWRLAFDPGTNVVQVHVSRLRAKLDRGFATPMLHTIRGAGYCLVAQT
ncbi:MAG: winged helix-turn-helix domain-containing protein [Sphingobium sp.]